MDSAERPDRLMIPGPIDYEPDVLQKMADPAFGHRGPTIVPIIKAIETNLHHIIGSDRDTYSTVIASGSGTYALEMAVRSWGEQNDERQILIPSIGVFGDLWAEICRECSVDFIQTRAEDGHTVNPGELDDLLSTGRFKAVALTHNDTSTGALNPLPELAEIVKRHNVLLFVDAVSSAGGVAINAAELGIDFIAMAPQKSLGVPPGLELAIVKDEALDAVSPTNKGYTTNILRHVAEIKTGTTLTTPAEAQMGALAMKLTRIVDEEGVEARFERHRQLMLMTHEWAMDEGLALLPGVEHASPTVSCFVNSRNLDLSAVFDQLASLKPTSYEFDRGHGKLTRPRVDQGLPGTFRIPHMGDLQISDLEAYLQALSETFTSLSA